MRINVGRIMKLGTATRKFLKKVVDFTWHMFTDYVITYGLQQKQEIKNTGVRIGLSKNCRSE